MIEYTDWETGETKRLVERVDVLEQQNAELLLALKKLISGYEDTTCTGLMDMCVAGTDVISAVSIIKKSEATE